MFFKSLIVALGMLLGAVSASAAGRLYPASATETACVHQLAERLFKIRDRKTAWDFFESTTSKQLGPHAFKIYWRRFTAEQKLEKKKHYFRVLFSQLRFPAVGLYDHTQPPNIEVHRTRLRARRDGNVWLHILITLAPKDPGRIDTWQTAFDLLLESKQCRVVDVRFDDFDVGLYIGEG